MTFLELREPASSLTHGAGLVLAVPATLLLLRNCGSDRGKRNSLLIYGFSLAACYGASTLFHGVQATSDRLRLFFVLDHIGIFLLIAGTYTPIAWTLFGGSWRRMLLVGVWSAAASGAALHAFCSSISISVSTAIYLTLGWCSLFGYVDLARRHSHRTLSPILIGGFCYTIGAAINLLLWPVPWPGVFESHEVFHVFVLAGSAVHYRFMWTVVLPAGGRPPTRPAPARRRPLVVLPALGRNRYATR